MPGSALSTLHIFTHPPNLVPFERCRDWASEHGDNQFKLWLLINGPASTPTQVMHFQSLNLADISSFQFSSVAQSCPTLCNPMNRSTPGLPVCHHLQNSLRLTSIESMMPSSHLILGCPLLLLPPIPTSIRVFSNESALQIRCPKLLLCIILYIIVYNTKLL